ncbi:MAG: hypothetical protein Q9227_003257 [Pyrenula ochraceoflavens]
MSMHHADATANAARNNHVHPESTKANPKGYFDIEKAMAQANLDTPEYNPSVNAKPCSPFYNHDVARPSVDHSKTASQTRINLAQVDTNDLEAGGAGTSKSSLDVVKQEHAAEADGSVKIWPGRLARILRLQGQPKKKSMCRVKQRGKPWLPGLTPKQRLMVKLLIALVIIGAMVGIGVGISKAVGGGVWKSDNQTSQIGG